jgi:FeS assembly SUF system regulator
MLRISKLADYATLIMSQLAKDGAALSSASLLAKSLHLSLPVVSKILKILCRAGLISSVRGAEGGYRLARLAQDITLAEVIAAIEGDFAVTECCSERGACALDATCRVKNKWKGINSIIYAALAKMTVGDLE